MVSNTGRTERIRKRKQKNAGRARKNRLANYGTSLPQDELFKVQQG